MDMTSESLLIRIMENTPHDRKLVEEFFAQMGEESTTFFNRGHGNEKRTLSWFDGQRQDHIFWIALAKDGNGKEEIAGYVFIWDKDKKVPWLGIAVAEHWKGRHLGRHLIGTVRKYCEERGYGGILLTVAPTNPRGLRLYENCGFEKVGTYHDGQFVYCLRFPL